MSRSEQFYQCIHLGHVWSGDEAVECARCGYSRSGLIERLQNMAHGQSAVDWSACAEAAALLANSAAHPDWHLCCEPTEEMLSVGYVEADGSISHLLTPDEMRSIWFRMHAAIRRDA